MDLGDGGWAGDSLVKKFPSNEKSNWIFFKQISLSIVDRLSEPSGAMLQVSIDKMNGAPDEDIAVFTEALRLPQEERDRYLSQVCKGDSEFRYRVGLPPSRACPAESA